MVVVPRLARAAPAVELEMQEVELVAPVVALALAAATARG